MCAETIRGFTHFVGIEEENVLVSIANLGEDFFLIHDLDILYINCTNMKPINNKNLMIPVFLYLITHSEFYFGLISFLRKHISKSFLSLRIAIDNTFTAYYLLKHPDKEGIYLSGMNNPEWNKIFRDIKKTIKNNLEEFPLAKDLPKFHEICSSYAHSDASGIIHRLNFDRENLRLEAKFFDYETSIKEFKKSLVRLLVPSFMIFLIFWTEIFKSLTEEDKQKEMEKNIKEYTLKLKAFQQKLS